MIKTDLNKIICTGTIINKFSILTSAHCFKESLNPDFYNVLAGPIHDSLKLKSNIHLYRDVFKINIYPKYNMTNNSVETDIAVIIINRPFIFGTKFEIYPACFTHEKIDFENRNIFTVTGFGLNYSYFNGYLDEFVELRNLRQTELEKVSCDNYNDLYVLCLTNNHSSICLGDSGGPVHFEYKNKYFVLGVSESLTPQLKDNKQLVCGPNSLQFFVLINSYMDWISQVSKRILCEDY